MLDSVLNLVPYRNQTGDVSLAMYPYMNDLYAGLEIPEIASTCYGTLMFYALTTKIVDSTMLPVSSPSVATNLYVLLGMQALFRILHAERLLGWSVIDLSETELQYTFDYTSINPNPKSDNFGTPLLPASGSLRARYCWTEDALVANTEFLDSISAKINEVLPQWPMKFGAASFLKDVLYHHVRRVAILCGMSGVTTRFTSSQTLYEYTQSESGLDLYDATAYSNGQFSGHYFGTVVPQIFSQYYT